MKRTEHGGIFLRLLFLLCFCCLLALLYVVRHPLMRFAAQAWVVDEPATPSDAVVVLGDDNFAGDRAFHAADLYRAGVAPVVVASGRMLRQNASVADLIQHDLESFGVPASSIVKLTHRADNTREEAGEVARLVQARGWKRIIVVTSNYHTRRARFIFERVFPSNIHLRVSAARDSDFDPAHWWESRQGRKLFMMELAGYMVARWELRSGAAAENGTALFVRKRQAGSQELLRGPIRLSLPYLIGHTARASRWLASAGAYYSSQVTVLSGLLCNRPDPWLRSFRWGIKNNVA